MVFSSNIHRYPPITLYIKIPWAQTFPQAASSLAGKPQHSDQPWRNNVGIIINLSGTYDQTFVVILLHEAEKNIIFN